MFEKTRARKGVTIAEITVALALVSIMITLIVSFVLSITERTKASLAYDAMRRDCTLIESVAERWMDEVAEKNFTVQDVTESYFAYFEFNSESYTLKFETNRFTGEYLEGTDPINRKSLTVYTETVKDVKFTVLTNGTEQLLILKVTCLNHDEKEVTSTICVNPHVGDDF